MDNPRTESTHRQGTTHRAPRSPERRRPHIRRLAVIRADGSNFTFVVPSGGLTPTRH